MPAVSVSRRHLCCCAASVALTTPLLSFIPAPDPDAEILAAVEGWMKLRPRMEALLRRRDAIFDESTVMVGLCPMESYEANRSWWGAWRATPAGQLEEEYGRVLEIADRHLTSATNTPAITARGIEAKIRLYRAAQALYDAYDDDGYMRQRIRDDIASVSIQRLT